MMRVMGGWIVEEMNSCTCGVGALSTYGHERMCGYELVARVEPLKAIVRSYPASWPGVPHSWQWLIPNPVGGEQDSFDFGWEETFERAIEEAHIKLRLLNELFATYAAMAVAS